MEYSRIISSCYAGGASEKLEISRQLMLDFGEALLENQPIVSQIVVVKDAVSDLDRHMGAMEMGKLCTRCAAKAGGGCCSVYMGNENNDALQLLMNMLVGIDVKQVRKDEVECCFLGKKGCILLFKPIFCLNYLCSTIREDSEVDVLQVLEQKTGFLLGEQVELERLIIRFLQEC